MWARHIIYTKTEAEEGGRNTEKKLRILEEKERKLRDRESEIRKLEKEVEMKKMILKWDIERLKKGRKGSRRKY